MSEWVKRIIFGVVCAAITAAIFVGIDYTSVNDVDKEKAELINANEDLKRDVEQKSNKINELSGFITKLESSVDDLKKESEGYKTAADELKTDNDGLEAQLKELQSSIAGMEAKIEEQNKTIEDLQVQKLINFDPSISYHTMYPHLYASLAEEYIVPENKTVYLTFDDGPSDRTDEILAILDKYNVKATFFVVPRRTDKCYARLNAILEAGHAIGIHTYSHDYDAIYASVEAFLEDFNKAYEIVVDATGYKPDIFRFPGGSLNDKSYKIIAEMTRRGFTYYDWNAVGDDSVGNPTVQSITENSIYWVGNKKEAILLLHDEHHNQFTV